MIDYTLPLEELPDPLPIEPLRKPFDVTITPPGSKSITCRAYVLAALAEGESRIIRPLRAEDTDHLLKALCMLGAEARWEGEDVLIKGVAGRFPRGGSVYLGDGGTPTRFMIACACLAAEPVIVDASPRMRERPIAEGVEMLRQLGAKIEYVEAEGRLPVRVSPSGGFQGGETEVGQTQSSQSISALALIAPHLKRGCDFRFIEAPTSPSYIWLTLTMLVDWGAIEEGQLSERRTAGFGKGEGLTIARQRCTSARQFQIEPDASAAVYWLMAAAVCRGNLIIPGLRRNSAQPDIGVIIGMDVKEALRTQGDAKQWLNQWMTTARCDVQWTSDREFPSMPWIDASSFPDGAVAFTAALACAPGRSKIVGLRTLRVKETDRIAALANELRKVGCTVETGEDWISIDPSTRHNKPVVIETYNDHRMAMAFAVLGLARPGISIRNPKCVAKSYPTFWKDFATLHQ